MASPRLGEARWWVRDWRRAVPTLPKEKLTRPRGSAETRSLEAMPCRSRQPRLVVRSISTVYPQGRFQAMRERPRGLAAQPFTGKKTRRLVAILLNPNDAYESASLTGVKRLQLGNAIVGAAEPPTKFAADVLHHHHIGMNIRLVTRVELFGRELVQQRWALRDDGG
jgi:hypothetical protein